MYIAMLEGGGHFWSSALGLSTMIACKLMMSSNWQKKEDKVF